MLIDGNTIQGHPTTVLLDENGNVAQTITVCAECGKMRTIIMLLGNKWYCSNCRVEGVSNPKMFPVS